MNLTLCEFLKVLLYVFELNMTFTDNCFYLFFTVIAGEEVESQHCVIENNENSVTLTPNEDALCCVNGNVVSESTKLTQGNSSGIYQGCLSLYNYYHEQDLVVSWSS